MEVERLAAKLEPLLPEEVKRWRRSRDMADPELASMLDHQLVSLAYKHLGDFRSKVLLSLPPERRIRGEVNLGQVLYEEEKWPAGISQGELLQNLAILGRSGAGKTNVAFHLLTQLHERGIPFLFLDWKRTARHLLPSLKGRVQVFTPGRQLNPLAFNPFMPPPGVDDAAYISQVVDVMADAYTLGDGARSLLQKAISRCYAAGNRAPSIADLLAELASLPSKGRVEGWKITATRALESLAHAQLLPNRASQEELAVSLTTRSTVIELDALSQSAKKFLVPLLCLWLFSCKLASPRREKLDLVIFVEEAHHLLYRGERQAKESTLNQLLRQCRELGIAVIVIDQHPSLLSTAALGNTYTSICLNQKSPSDIAKAAALSLVPDGEKKIFSRLPVGHAVIKLQDRWTRPFLARFPPLEIRKGAVSDQILAEYLALQGSLSGFWARVAPSSAANERFRPEEAPLTAQELAFLADVLAHPDDGVDRRYKRLGYSGDKGNRIKSKLVTASFLTTESIKVGRTRKLILRLSPEALAFLGANPENLKAPRADASLTHEYWKRFYAKRYEAAGYSARLEAPRPRGGVVDVVAEKEDEHIAIEVETGKSDAVLNVQRDLLSGFSKVVVVAPDEAGLAKVEHQLAKAGLVIPARVELVLRDGHRVKTREAA